MGEVRSISEIIQQSENFKAAQDKWNQQFNRKSEPNDNEKEYYKKVFGEKSKAVPIKYEKLRTKFWEIAKILVPDYKIEDSEKYRNLVKYFAGEAGELDPEKGLLINGGTGSGKSKFFSVMQQSLLNLRASAYRIVSCIDVEQSIRMESMGVESNPYQHFNHGVMCFDDLGTESSETVIYGNRVNVMSEILQLRYNSFQNKGVKTHITTNLLMSEIEKRYGTRISDRISEMCNIVIFSWESFRK